MPSSAWSWLTPILPFPTRRSSDLMVYTTELSPPSRRGLVSSCTVAGTTIGFILGSGSAWLVNALLSADQVTAWGWRSPFVGSVVFRSEEHTSVLQSLRQLVCRLLHGPGSHLYCLSLHDALPI